VNQPFSSLSISSHVAGAYFDVLVTRAGVLRLAIGSQTFVNITLGCGNGQFPALGYDDQGKPTVSSVTSNLSPGPMLTCDFLPGNAYAAQFAVLDITAGCPSDVIGTSCESSAASASASAAACFPPCGANQTCVLASGYGSCVAASRR
jgi:hypothetical protein